MIERALLGTPGPTSSTTVADAGAPGVCASGADDRPRSFRTTILPTSRTTGAPIAMAIEVKIPTILRTYTGGAKTVEAKGDTLDRAHRRPGRQPRRPQGPADHRRRQPAPVRQRLRQRRGRPLHRLARHRAEGRRHRDDPAGRRRRLIARPRWPATTRCSTRSATPRSSGCRGCPRAGTATEPGAAVGQARGPQPDRLDQGPRRAGDDPRGRGRRPADARAARSSSRRRATPASRWRWSPSCAATGWSA